MRRNRAAVRAGRVDLRLADVEGLPRFDQPFDKVLAVNSLGFWPDPVARLAHLRALMREGGTVAIVSQPRCRGATAEHTDRDERDIRRGLAGAGFRDVRAERLDLDPPATCVLASA